MRASARSFALFAAGVLLAATPPATVKKPVTDDYSGVKVTDDYRWLEDWSDPAVRQWSDAQNQYARAYLDALPTRKSVYAELERIVNRASPDYFDLTWRGGRLFALVETPPKEQPVLSVIDSPDDPASVRTVLDPTKIDSTGGSTIDFYVPSLDGKYVAVSLSQGGSESGDVHVYETDTGKELPDVISRVNGGTAGGSVAWNGDGSGLYYTRYPRAGERPPADMAFYQQVWFHKLGSPASADRYSLGKDFPKIAEISLQISDDGRYLLARMAYGDGGEFTHYLMGPDGQWRQIARLADAVVAAAFGDGGAIYLLSRQNAPMGKVLKISVEKPQIASAQTVVPEGRVAIQSILPAGDWLYVNGLSGGPSRIDVFDASGKRLGMVGMGQPSAVSGMVRYKDGQLLFRSASYTTPPAWVRVDPATRQPIPTALRKAAPVDLQDALVTRETAISKDGTRVPLTIIRKKGTKLDGNNPALLYGYGGYGISMTPAYDPTLRVLLDRGVVYAVANLRGGGEFGEAWHKAGMLTKKQNVFDDFAACAEYLIKQRYTSPARLAIEGGSNGGLLMGAALAQHPNLFRAVVSHVGIYDMLRVELSPNGAFNVTEFGSVKELEQFKALNAYSPYHHVTDGTEYPAVLFLTGANDPRVDPMQSRKMTARLQAGGTKQPVLLRTSSGSGHGIGTALSEAVAQGADTLAFLFEQWGVK
ncbi:MAG: prolyl oligopeptidase family serine peptidase [Acidobacteriia bacterium]|nr:prolyl oligopeptidase family serine peptidase [Terriglobia bacterium]